MKRNKAYYSKKLIRDLIKDDKIRITQKALLKAMDDFGWDVYGICSALLALSIEDCYQSQPRYQNPSIFVDYYRAYGLKGENVYTHFFVEDGILVVDSFKEI